MGRTPLKPEKVGRRRYLGQNSGDDSGWLYDLISHRSDRELADVKVAEKHVDMLVTSRARGLIGCNRWCILPGSR